MTSCDVIFTNGIRNDRNQAEALQDKLELRIERPVILCHNPTGIIDGILNPNSDATNQCVEDLKGKIIHSLNGRRQVFLILHSKGAHIGLKALSSLGQSHQKQLLQYVTVHAYGGIVLLPEKLAKSVQNTADTWDMLAEDGGHIARANDTSPATQDMAVWNFSWKQFAKTGNNPPKPGYRVKVADRGGVFTNHSFSSIYLEEAASDFKLFSQCLQHQPQRKHSSIVCYAVIAIMISCWLLSNLSEKEEK